MISENDAHSAKKSFFSGVALLTASALAVKLIGLFYKIPLVNLIGIEGMAYFLAAYHVYTLLFVISTAGLPVAVSIIVSKRRAVGDLSGAEAVFFCSLKVFAVLGVLCTAAMWLGAEAITGAIRIPEAAASLRAIAPALFFVAVGSAVKGYFQGIGLMYPTGISQVLESAGKLGFGLLLAKYAMDKGEHFYVCAAYAIAGITLGSALSCAYLLFLKFKKRAEKPSKYKKGIIAELLKKAAPITLGAAVISLCGAVDTALISSRLQVAGFDPTIANSMYSSYGNLAIPLYNIVPSFIAPIAVAIAPMLARAHQMGARERERSLINSAMKLCALISVPASFGLSVFAEPILSLIYPSQSVGINTAAPLLSVLAPAVFFSCMITVTNSVLQAYGKERKPIVSMLVGTVLKITLEYILLGMPQINIYAAPISTLACNFTIVFLNIGYTEKYSGGTGFAKKLTRPMLAAATATAISSALYFLFRGAGAGNSIAALTAIALDVLFYIIVATLNGSFEEDDLALLPRGDKIIKVMKKIKMLRS